MKKFVAFILVLALCLSLCSVTAFASAPVTTNIMTAAEGGDDTGLRLTGDHEAVYGQDYTAEINEYDVDIVEIYINTSDWKITGVVDDAFEGRTLMVTLGTTQNEPYNFTIGDIDQNGAKVTVDGLSKSDFTATIDTENDLELDSFTISANNGVATLNLDEQNQIIVKHFAIQSGGDANIYGPGTIEAKLLMQAISGTGNVNFVNATVNSHLKSLGEGDETYCAAMFMGNISFKENSKLFAVNELTKGQLESGSSMGVMFMSGSLTVDETSECFISGKDTAVKSMSTGFISDYTGWKCSADVVLYADKADMTADADEVYIEAEESNMVKVKDSDPAVIAKTLYKAGTGTEPESDWDCKTLAKGAAIAAGITVVTVGTIHTVKAVGNAIKTAVVMPCVVHAMKWAVPAALAALCRAVWHLR